MIRFINRIFMTYVDGGIICCLSHLQTSNRSHVDEMVRAVCPAIKLALGVTWTFCFRLTTVAWEEPGTCIVLNVVCVPRILGLARAIRPLLDRVCSVSCNPTAEVGLVPGPSCSLGVGSPLGWTEPYLRVCLTFGPLFTVCTIQSPSFPLPEDLLSDHCWS